MSEIILAVREDENEGGFSAPALGCSSHTQAESMSGLRGHVREAVDCYFNGGTEGPNVLDEAAEWHSHC